MRNSRNLSIVRVALAILIGTAAMEVGTPRAARADIVQSVKAKYVASGGSSFMEDTDEITAVMGAVPSRDILAAISGQFGVASAAVDRFGHVGVSGSLLQRSSLETTVQIISQGENFNFSGVPLRARASFFIDGGSMRMFAGAVSSITLDLFIDFRVIDAFGATFSETEFQSALSLLQVSPGVNGLSFFADFSSLHATFDGFNVNIPPGLQIVDLGLIPASAHIDIIYSLRFLGLVADFVEVMEWSYSDPLNVSGTGAFPTISFDVATVPEPSSLVLVAIGVLSLVVRSLGRREQRRHGKHRYTPACSSGSKNHTRMA